MTLIVHLFLAALKLPAGILSGSVGLLNDAIDTLLDGVSSLLVYWGLRVNRERLVSRILVLFMLATGTFTLIEAVLRIFRREPVEADWFAFAAVLVSAAVCGALWGVFSSPCSICTTTTVNYQRSIKVLTKNPNHICQVSISLPIEWALAR